MAFAPLAVAGYGGFVVGAVVALAGMASVALATIGVLAFRERRTKPYCFVAAALVVLAVKAFVGGVTLAGLLGVRTHHIIEHGLDFLMAVMLITAIYAARRPTKFDSLTEGLLP
ncbi:MAG: hypothetical protein ABEJ59_00685 [Halanaeroarchaeum sp.]